MAAALAAARAALPLGEVPVGAAVFAGDRELARAHNDTIAGRDLSRHAELLAIQAALRALALDRFADDVTLYITLEPCAQCAGAILLTRVPRVVFGAWDPKAGMAGSIHDLLRHPKLHHRPEVIGGVMEAECGELLAGFFRDRREPGAGSREP